MRSRIHNERDTSKRVLEKLRELGGRAKVATIHQAINPRIDFDRVYESLGHLSRTHRVVRISPPRVTPQEEVIYEIPREEQS